MDYKEKVIALLSNQELSKEQKEKLENIFPELKESEDEKNIKDLIDELKCSLRAANCQNEACNGGHEKRIALLEWAIAWLEKQGEQEPVLITDEWIEDYWKHHKVINPYSYDKGEEIQFDHRGFVKFCKNYCKKPADNVEPKFHEGDWIVHHDTENIYQVVAVTDNQYQLKNGDVYILQNCADVDRYARLYDVAKDAKDGDVLVASDESIFIYAGSTDRYAKFYVALTNYGTFNFDGGNWEDKNIVHPSTKKQRDLLFQKMKEAGYEWDAEKKEVKKIDVKTLDPDKVIAWLVANICNYEYYVKLFKKDFGL